MSIDCVPDPGASDWKNLKSLQRQDYCVCGAARHQKPWYLRESGRGMRPQKGVRMIKSNLNARVSTKSRFPFPSPVRLRSYTATKPHTHTCRHTSTHICNLVNIHLHAHVYIYGNIQISHIHGRRDTEKQGMNTHNHSDTHVQFKSQDVKKCFTHIEEYKPLHQTLAKHR